MLGSAGFAAVSEIHRRLCLRSLIGEKSPLRALQRISYAGEGLKTTSSHFSGFPTRDFTISIVPYTGRQNANSLHQSSDATMRPPDPVPSVREAIQASRCRNFENRHFVPVRALHNILTVDVVRSVVRQIFTESQEQSEIIRRIKDGGERTFAILISI